MGFGLKAKLLLSLTKPNCRRSLTLTVLPHWIKCMCVSFHCKDSTLVDLYKQVFGINMVMVKVIQY